MSSFFFEIKGAKEDKTFKFSNFQFFQFLRNGGPMDMILACFQRSERGF